MIENASGSGIYVGASANGMFAALAAGLPIPIVPAAMLWPTHYEYAVFSNFAYLTADQLLGTAPITDPAYGRAGIEDPKAWLAERGWELYCTPAEAAVTSYYGHAFLHRNRQQLVLAHRGTAGLEDWLKCNIPAVVGNAITERQRRAEEFTEKTLDKLKAERLILADHQELQGFHLSFTGHSLGGWLAILSASRFNKERFAPAVTFDAPGAYHMIERTEGMGGHHIYGEGIDYRLLPVISYVAGPNMVNTCNEHVGELRRLYPNTPERGDVMQWMRYTLDQHNILDLLQCFDPDTGLPSCQGEAIACKRVMRWPRVDVAPVTASGLGVLKSIFSFNWGSAIAEVTLLCKSVFDARREYVGFHHFANRADRYEPKVETLSYRDQYRIQCEFHYEAELINWRVIEARHLPPKIRKFLKKAAGKSAYLKPGTYGFTQEHLRELSYYDYDKDALFPVVRLNAQAPADLTAQDFCARIAGWFTNSAQAQALDKFVRENVVLRILETYTLPILDSLKAAPLCWNLPAKVKDFFGRRKELEAMQQQLSLEAGNFVCQVISGMGGIGKTSLLLEYAHEMLKARVYSHVIWCAAAESLLLQWQELAIALGETKEAAASLSPELLIRRVHQHLQDQPSVLLVFDNVDDAETVQAYLPKVGGRVRVLMSSRSQLTELPEATHNPVILNSFAEEETITYLRGVLPGEAVEQCAALAQRLGNLPLALAQAVAYLQKNHRNIEWYLDQISSPRRGRQLLSTVAETWRISYELLQTTEPKALILLYQLAYLAPDDIPRFLVDALGQSDLETDRLLSILGDYSLISFAPNGNIRIHRLLQEVLRFEQQDDFEYLKQILEVVSTQFDFDQYNTEGYQKARLMLVQANYILACLEQHQGVLSRELQLLQAQILGILGECVGRLQGNWRKALEIYQNQARVLRQVYGEVEHLDCVRNLNNHSLCYWNLRDRPQLVHYATEALAMLIRILGAEQVHKDQANSLNLIGIYYQEIGDKDRAVVYHEQALAIRKTIYGEWHFEVARSLNNLSTCYSGLGQVEEALRNITQALAIQKFLCGDSANPEVARSLCNIASISKRLGLFNEALEYAQQALLINKSCYGEQHPDVAHDLNIIGVVYHSLNNAQEAIKYQEQAVMMLKDIYGEQHPKTLLFLRELAESCRQFKHLPQALSCFKQALDISLSYYGAQHVEVAKNLNRLAQCYRESGENHAALEHYRQVLAMRDVLLNDKKEILESLYCMGLVYKNLGDDQGQLDFHLQALEFAKTLTKTEMAPLELGDCLNNVAASYEDLREWTQALDYYTQSLAAHLASHGHQHQKVSKSLENIGDIHAATKHFQEVLNAYDQALEIKQALGLEVKDLQEKRDATYRQLHPRRCAVM